jgi:hypothetical protein
MPWTQPEQEVFGDKTNILDMVTYEEKKMRPEDCIHLPSHRNLVGNMHQNVCDGNHNTILHPCIFSPIQQ